MLQSHSPQLFACSGSGALIDFTLLASTRASDYIVDSGTGLSVSQVPFVQDLLICLKPSRFVLIVLDLTLSTNSIFNMCETRENQHNMQWGATVRR